MLRAGALARTNVLCRRACCWSKSSSEILIRVCYRLKSVSYWLQFGWLFFRLFGLIANFALVFNLAMILTFMSWIGASLTLPGIAGIVIGIGMAVDANVLICERIREEMLSGLPPLNKRLSRVMIGPTTPFLTRGA